MSESWGTIQQPSFQDAMWESSMSKSNNLQAENWERQPPSGNWGTERPSASSPSENNLSARKAVQGSWGQNKSENSWVMRNEDVHVDQSSWQRKEEPPISTSYKSIKRGEEEEKLDVGIQQSFETLKNDGYERQNIVLEEDDYDPNYDSYSSKQQLSKSIAAPFDDNYSSKPQLNKSITAPFDDEIQYNDTSDMYNVKSHVEPLITSSNSTFQESPNRGFRSVEVQTDPIDLAAISASNEKLLSCTISSQIKKGYQQTSQDLSRSTTNSVPEKRYPQQPPSLLDVDPEEWNTKVANSLNTTSGNPSFREDTAALPKPNSDSWDNKPTPMQNDSWYTTQRTSAPQTNDNRSTIPKPIPVEPDSWDSTTRNDNRGIVPKPIPVEPDSWDSTTRNDNRGTVPKPIPVEPDTWDSTPRKDNHSTVPKPIPVESDSWDSTPQTSTQNDRGSTTQPLPSWNPIPQPSQDNSWGSGTQQPTASGPSDDWTKKAEMYSKELGEKNEIKTWSQANNTEQKVEDSYGTGASDSYYNNSSSNNRYGSRDCHNCGQEGHIARDCPDKKQGNSGGRTCHKCHKEGHLARDCTEGGGGYGGYSGGGYGGGKSCHTCGKEGHLARDCTEEGGRGSYGGGRTCRNCGKEGHLARDCTEESGRGSYGGGRPCHKCHKEGHFARDCKEDVYEESREFNNSGLSRPHTNKPSPFSSSELPNISSQEAWDKLLKTADENDTDDFKEALEAYAKVTPDETFVSIEKKLRAANSNGRIIAFERPEIPLTKVLVDLQGNTNKKYVAIPTLVHPSRLPRTSGNRASSQEENLYWLTDSGYMVDDRSPVCFNCKQKGHITKECPEPKREIEKQPYLTCQNCNSSEHMTKYCPEERRDYYAEARDRKVAGSHKGGSMEYSATEDRASSSYDGEGDRKGYRGYGNNNNNLTCYNCNREGHTSRDCPEPRRSSGARKCNKCGEEGHISRDCPSGGDYDRGNYNSSGGWQRDSSSRNNDRAATWGNQDKSGDNTWNRHRNDSYSQNNLGNKSRGDNLSHDDYNQDNTWSKSRNDNYSQPRGDNSSRGDYNQDNTWSKPRNDNYSQPRGDNSSRGDYNQDNNTWSKPRNDNYSQNNSWNKYRDDNSSRGDQDNTRNKPRNDNYSQDNKPKGDNFSRGDYIQDNNTWSRPGNDNYSQNNSWKPRGDNSSRSDQDNTWSKPRNDNRSQDNSWSKPRGGNSSRGDNNQENTWNKTRNDHSQDNPWNKSGGGNSLRGDNDQDNKVGDTSQQRDNQPNLTPYKVESDSWDSKPVTENTSTQNKWGSGNVTAEDFGWSKSKENKESVTSAPENYENGRGRGYGQRERSENYENRRGRGYDQRERTPVSENYDYRRGRDNEQRERTSASENRRGYTNEPREERYNKGPNYTNSSRTTQSNDANNNPSNLDENPNPWW